MSDKSAIEWTDATWNPTVGCTKVSPGCDHCYAEGTVNRWHAAGSLAFPNRFDVVHVRNETQMSKPLHWSKPRMVFVNSLSDLFHDDISDDVIADVFAVMALAGQHTYQLLTKRHARMRSLLNTWGFRQSVSDAMGRRWRTLSTRNPQPRHVDLDAGGPMWPLPNVWLGVSIESQQWANIRIPALNTTPAAVRFLSLEPLLEGVDLEQHLFSFCRREDEQCPRALRGERCDECLVTHQRIDWVIVGGESGPEHRPIEADWVRRIRNQCALADVPFFFKQWGGATAKAGGRLLDGRTHDEYPRELVTS